nr:unnamed protein product [Callosobruchus analis]
MKSMQNQWFTDELKKYRECLKIQTQTNRPHLVSNDETKNFRTLYSNKIQEAKRQDNDKYEYIRKSGNPKRGTTIEPSMCHIYPSVV